jgi:Predicted dehydrogenases and related proteins
MMRLRAVLTGYGNMGKTWRHVLASRPEIELVGVTDLLEDNLVQAKEQAGLGDDQVATSLEELIVRVKPDIVIDCSAPQAHSANTKLALRHGCHVLGEKPIALTLDGAKDVVAAARNSGKIYMVNQNYRWRPIMIELKKYLERSPIGRLVSINVLHAQQFVFKDTFRKRIDNPFLLDMAVHHFDLVRSLTGADYRTVYCQESNPPSSQFASGASASAIFIMNNGVVLRTRVRGVKWAPARALWETGELPANTAPSHGTVAEIRRLNGL